MNGKRLVSLGLAVMLAAGLLSSVTSAADAATTFDPHNELASTPPMGWNSYNIFGGTFFSEMQDCSLPSCIPLNEERVMEIAQALIDTGLRDKGYEYVNLDDRWQDPRQPRDVSGDLRWDDRRFPSGIPALAEWLHNRGFKLGIYALPNDRPCGGEEGPTNKPNWPSGLPETSSLGHEYQDVASFAEWGVDYIKLDWCGVNETGTRHHAGEVFELWDQAIAATGRPMILAASTWGWENESTWGPDYAHSWRIYGDVTPDWSKPSPYWDNMMATVDAGSTPTLRSASGPTKGWNDFDSMQVGNPGLTEAENRSHFVMWSMANSPLLLSNDLRTRDAEHPLGITADTLDLIGNEEIIAVNQDPMGEQAWLAKDWGNGLQVWARSLADGSKAVALLNRSTTGANIVMGFDDIFLGSQAGHIRDLVNHHDFGTFSTAYTIEVGAHDTVMFKVTPVESTSYEVEGGTLIGGARVQTCQVCSGGHNVGYVGNNQGKAELSVVATEAGPYSVTLYYNSGDPRPLYVSASSGDEVSLSGLNSGSWQSIAAYTVVLNLDAGTNTIQLHVPFPGGWAPDLDRIVVASNWLS